MHERAKKYDLEALKRFYAQEPPEGRPCDWCGQPVTGMKNEPEYIHDKCLKKESKLYMDLLY